MENGKVSRFSSLSSREEEKLTFFKICFLLEIVRAAV